MLQQFLSVNIGPVNKIFTQYYKTISILGVLHKHHLVQQQQQQQPFILMRLFFPSVLGSTSPMAFPQHSPPPSPVPSIFPTKSLLSHIFFQHFSPSLPGPAFHSITIYLQCLNSLYPTQLISTLNMTKLSQPVSLHDFSNVINCQHAPHTLITVTFT